MELLTGKMNIYLELLKHGNVVSNLARKITHFLLHSHRFDITIVIKKDLYIQYKYCLFIFIVLLPYCY